MTIHDLKRPFTSFDLLLEVVALSLLIKTVVMITEQYALLSDQIPIHYSFSGEPNGFGAKVLIWILPLLGFSIHGLLTLLGRRPDKLRYPVVITPENYQRQYSNLIRLIRFLKLVVSGIILWLTYETITNLNPNDSGIHPVMILIVSGIVIGVIGLFVYRSYRMR